MLTRRSFVGGSAAVGAAFAGGASFAQSLTPVQIVNSAGNLNLTLQELLRRQRFMESFGVEARTVNISDGSKVMASLLSGEQDICMFAGVGQVFPAIEKGAKIKIVAGATMTPDQAVYTANPSIRTVKDLKGKTIGVGALGSLLHVIMVALLRKHGVDPESVTFVNIGSSADVFRAIAAKKIDAGPSQLEIYFHQERFGVRALEDGKFWEEFPTATFQAAFTTEETIAKKRDAIVRTLAAYGKLYRFICLEKSFEAFSAAAQAATGRKDAEDAVDEWKFFQQYRTLATDLVIDPQRIRFLQDLNVLLGVQKSEMPFDQVADMSLARDALKLMAG